MPLGRRNPRDFTQTGGSKRESRLLRVRAKGIGRWHPTDLYHELLRMSWPQVAVIFVVSFVSFNLLFGWLYWLDPNGIGTGPAQVNTSSFWQYFFFSVQTVATIGYGHIYPLSVYANVLVVIEITFGILFFALVTGIAFARFSRPTARILFSSYAVVHQVAGVPTLMFRVANLRRNLVFEARAVVSLLTDETLGHTVLRRFENLKLERDSNPIFALTWTIMHRIDASSPLKDWKQGQDGQPTSELVVIISGVDDRTGQTIHGRWLYLPSEVRWGAKFVDIIDQTQDGSRTIDYRRFHDFVPAEEGDRPA